VVASVVTGVVVHLNNYNKYTEVTKMITKTEAEKKHTCEGCGKSLVIGYCEECQTPDYPQQDW
jgi:hypothetical protein